MKQRLRRFAEVLFGEGGAVPSDPDDIFAVTTAYTTMGVEGYESLDRAGLCFSHVDSLAFERVVDDVDELLRLSTETSDADYDVVEDNYGYWWVLLEDRVFDDLVSTIYVASDALIDAGYTDHLLCAGFSFERDAEAYWIYNFKRGSWYPFVPDGDGERNRDVERHLEGIGARALELERDPSRRYPLWGIPF